MQGGSGVSGGSTVAGVAADGTGVTDLGAADHIDCFAQNIDVLLDQRIVGDVGEGGKAADAQGAVLFHLNTTDLVQTLDAQQGLASTLTFTHLNQNVGAAGNDVSFGVCQVQFNSFLNALCLVQNINIIHSE